MFLSIGRKLSAHLFTTCIFCILILIVLIGGLIQVISSVAFSAYLENSNDLQQQQQEVTISTAGVTTSPFSVLSFDGSSVVDQMYDVTRHNKKNGTAFGKAVANSVGKSKSNDIHAPASSMKNDHGDKLSGDDGDARGFLSTKILYKPYTVTSNEQYNQLDKSPISSSLLLSTAGGGSGSSSSNSKSKTINLTVYKSVTPSITDRVIADLKKEEYLAQQRAKTTIDSDENDEAIYIDGDDDDDDATAAGAAAAAAAADVRRRNFTADIETSIEKLPSTDLIAEITDDDVRVKAKPKSKAKSNQKSKANGLAQTIGVRDKKSSKKPIIITQKYKSFDETLNINDDDDYDQYANSGSGDFSSSNSQLNERETDPDWVAPSIEKIKAKKMNKQERIMKSFAENSYGDGIVDVSKEAFDDAEGGIDGIDFIDKDDDQMISQKIAKATATKKKQQKSNAGNNDNQKFKPKLKSKPKSKSKQPLTNRQKANNKRKSKEQQYIEEYFSGTKTNNNGNSDSSAGTEAELIKVNMGF